MKRARIYKPRRGIRFDRAPTKGPAGSFIGGTGLQVLSLSGSVERSVTEPSGRFSYPSVPFAGYPRSSGQMNVACGGLGTWVDGFLLEETNAGLTSSFDQTHTLDVRNELLVSYRVVGPRGPIDDYAVGLPATGALSTFFSSSVQLGQTAYGLTTTSDLAILFVAKMNNSGSTAGNSDYIFQKRSTVTGWEILNWNSTTVPGVALAFTFDDAGHVAQSTTLATGIPFGNWFVGLWVAERGSVNKARISTLDVSTGLLSQSLEFSIAGWGDMSAADDGNGAERNAFHFGGWVNGGAQAFSADMAVSAFYIASGTNAASGIFGNEANVLRSFVQTVKAKSGYLFTGSFEIDRSIGSFGTQAESRYVTQRLLGLSTASLGRSSGFVGVTTGSIPSWTNSHIRNSAFVITTLSSSDHESQVLGYMRSGSEAIESSAVPAYRTLYYSKKTIPYVSPGNGFSRTTPLVYSRTYGIGLNTGTLDQNQYALICRLSGVLADISGTTPGWLLNNEFRTPVVPISSASLVETTPTPIVGIRPQDILLDRSILDGARRLSDAARDASPPRTLARRHESSISGTSAT